MLIFEGTDYILHILSEPEIGRSIFNHGSAGAGRPGPCVPSFAGFWLLANTRIDIFPKNTVIKQGRHHPNFMFSADRQELCKYFPEIGWIIFPNNKLQNHPK